MPAQAQLIGVGGGSVTVGNYGISKNHCVCYFPEAVNIKKTQNLAEIAVPGLNHPVIMYVGGSAIKIRADILLYGYDSNPPVSIQSEIDTMLGWVLSESNGTSSLPGQLPPYVSVYFGGVPSYILSFVSDLDIKVTMYEETTLEPIEATVSIEFTEYVPIALAGGTSKKSSVHTGGGGGRKQSGNRNWNGNPPHVYGNPVLGGPGVQDAPTAFDINDPRQRENYVQPREAYTNPNFVNQITGLDKIIGK